MKLANIPYDLTYSDTGQAYITTGGNDRNPVSRKEAVQFEILIRLARVIYLLEKGTVK